MELTMKNMEAYMKEVDVIIDKSHNELSKYYAKLEDK